MQIVKTSSYAFDEKNKNDRKSEFMLCVFYKVYNNSYPVSATTRNVCSVKTANKPIYAQKKILVHYIDLQKK